MQRLVREFVGGRAASDAPLFPVITCMEVLEHVPKQREFLGALAAILRELSPDQGNVTAVGGERESNTESNAESPSAERVRGTRGLLVGSTIAAGPLSRLTTITLAEDVLRLVPRGTHDPGLFVDAWDDLLPWLRDAGFRTDALDVTPALYEPLGGRWRRLPGFRPADPEPPGLSRALLTNFFFSVPL